MRQQSTTAGCCGGDSNELLPFPATFGVQTVKKMFIVLPGHVLYQFTEPRGTEVFVGLSGIPTYSLVDSSRMYYVGVRFCCVLIPYNDQKALQRLRCLALIFLNAECQMMNRIPVL